MSSSLLSVLCVGSFVQFFGVLTRVFLIFEFVKQIEAPKHVLGLTIVLSMFVVCCSVFVLCVADLLRLPSNKRNTCHRFNNFAADFGMVLLFVFVDFVYLGIDCWCKAKPTKHVTG